jgi:hypothetical protein
MIPIVMTISRRTHANDVAQAKLFHAILLGELNEASELADSAERSWLKRCRRGIEDGHHIPPALALLRAHVAEVQNLLDAVAARSPHG